MTYENNRITATSGTVTLQSLYDASESNSWGVIDKNGSIYVARCSIYVEGSANLQIGYLVNEERIIFDYSVELNWYCLYFNSTGTARLGLRTTKSRNAFISTILIPNTARRRLYFEGNVEIVNTVFDYTNYFYAYGKVGFSVIIDRCYLMYSHFGINLRYAEVSNLTIDGSYYSISVQEGVTLNYITTFDSSRSFIDSSVSALLYIRNVRLIEPSISSSYVRTNLVTGGKNIYFIDCEIVKGTFGFYKNGSLISYNKSTQYLQSTFQIQCSEDGATVRLYNKDDIVVLDDITNINGVCTAEITSYESWNTYDNNVLIDDDDYDSEPFKLVLSKEGYQDFVINEIYMTEEVSPGLRRGTLYPTIIRADLVRPVTGELMKPEVKAEIEPTEISIIEVETE